MRVSDSMIERAAEALWRADPHVPDICRWPDAAPNPDGIRRAARAVVDALGLTEEFTWSWPESLTVSGGRGYGYSVGTAEEARLEADLSYMTIVRRLVTWLAGHSDYHWAPMYAPNAKGNRDD